MMSCGSQSPAAWASPEGLMETDYGLHPADLGWGLRTCISNKVQEILMLLVQESCFENLRVEGGTPHQGSLEVKVLPGMELSGKGSCRTCLGLRPKGLKQALRTSGVD